MTFRCDRRGTAAVEFSIAASAVLTVIFAMFDIGLLFTSQHALDWGVEKAARYAVVNSTASVATIKRQFVSAVTPALGATQAGNAVVSVTFSPSEKVGGTVTIKATLAWSPAAAIDTIAAATLSSSQTLTIQH